MCVVSANSIIHRFPIFLCLLPLFSPRYPFEVNGLNLRKCPKSFKIEGNGFNVFVYLDTQLYANELADAAERRERKNEQNDAKVQKELQRREKGVGKLTEEQMDLLQPRDMKKVLQDIPEMGTVTLRTNRTDLNSHQVYRTYKQRQSIEQFFKTYGVLADTLV